MDNDKAKKQKIKSLELILDYGYKTYEHIAINRQEIQMSYVKFYNTISIAIITAIFAVVSFLYKDIPLFISNYFCLFILWVLLLFFSLLLSLYVFSKTIDTLKGRFDRPICFSEINGIYNFLLSNISDIDLYEKILNSFTQSISKSHEPILKEISRIGKDLRKFSVSLIISFILAVICISLIFIITLINKIN